jgi:hypothetical protein
VIKIKKNCMEGSFSTYGAKVAAHTGVWCGNVREGAHLDYPDACGRTTLKWIFHKWDERV